MQIQTVMSMRMIIVKILSNYRYQRSKTAIFNHLKNCVIVQKIT